MTATAVSSRPSSGTLYDVVDVILDKGLVIDAFVRVSLVGIELLTIDVRVVVASVDTYLHFAEATNRLDLSSGKRQGGGLSNLTGALGGLPGAGGVPGGLPAPQLGDAIEGGLDQLQKTSALAESAKGTASGAAQSAQQTASGAAQMPQQQMPQQQTPQQQTPQQQTPQQQTPQQQTPQQQTPQQQTPQQQTPQQQTPSGGNQG